jgi:uncharacterized protein YjbI with pentapeptide repeats
MSDVTFAHADIRGSDFSGVDMTNVDLSSALMSGTIFTAATVVGLKGLAGSDLSGAQMDKINFQNFSFVGSKITNVLLDQSDLSGVDFSGAVIWFESRDVDISYNNSSSFATEVQRACNSQGANNDGINFRGVEFKGYHPFKGTFDLSRVKTMEGIVAVDAAYPLDLSHCILGPRIQ